MMIMWYERSPPPPGWMKLNTDTDLHSSNAPELHLLIIFPPNCQQLRSIEQHPPGYPLTQKGGATKLAHYS